MTEVADAARPALPPPRRWAASRLAAALALFLSGCVFGAGGAAFAVRRAAQRAVRHPEVRAGRAAQWLGRRLDLDQAQREKVGEILRRQAAELEGLRLSVWPRVREVMKETEREIDATLRPEQRVKWKRLVERLERNWLPPGAATGS